MGQAAVAVVGDLNDRSVVSRFPLPHGQSIRPPWAGLCRRRDNRSRCRKHPGEDTLYLREYLLLVLDGQINILFETSLLKRRKRPRATVYRWLQMAQASAESVGFGFFDNLCACGFMSPGAWVSGTTMQVSDIRCAALTTTPGCSPMNSGEYASAGKSTQNTWPTRGVPCKLCERLVIRTQPAASIAVKLE